MNRNFRQKSIVQENINTLSPHTHLGDSLHHLQTGSAAKGTQPTDIPEKADNTSNKPTGHWQLALPYVNLRKDQSLAVAIGSVFGWGKFKDLSLDILFSGLWLLY